MTTVITLSEFLQNPVTHINNCIMQEEITKIQTEKGAAVLITEEQYDAFLELLIRATVKNKR